MMHEYMFKFLYRVCIKMLGVSYVSFMFSNFFSTDPTYRKDYYKILGVSNNADQKEIKKAYFNVSTFTFSGVQCCNNS